jgi:dihydropteroate synthase
MTCRVIALANQKEAAAELSIIGSDRRGVELMAPKSVLRAVKVTSLRPVAANIIKQEMLSFGGEAATNYGSINLSAKTTDVLILGTIKQFNQLTNKLINHQFGLPQVAREIATALDNYELTPKPIGKFIFGQRTYVMGILNVTPDSFSDGGRYRSVEAAIEHGRQMIADGADIIDVGGESSRPGAKPVSTQEEITRVVPVIKKLAQVKGAFISIDTTKAKVAAVAIDAGAKMVNDISALRFDRAMGKIIAAAKVPVCLMHMQGRPQTMQKKPVYTDLIGEIMADYYEGLAIAKRAGILLEKIILDPGIGFGKTVAHNLEILRRLREFKVLGQPILVGTSRKSVIGQVLGLPVAERLMGTAATVSLAINNGADLVRVHDVKELRQVVQMSDAIVRRQK